MTRKVSSLQQLLEVVRQPDRVELDNTTGELLDSTWVYISMDVVVAVQEIESEHNLVRYVEELLEGKVLLAERLPV